MRHGEALRFELATVGCGGGQRYFGFTQQLRPEFEYFLSCGIPGKVVGERYKKSPELVKKAMKYLATLPPNKFFIYVQTGHFKSAVGFNPAGGVALPESCK